MPPDPRLPRPPGRPRQYAELSENYFQIPLEVSLKDDLKRMSAETGISMTQILLRSAKYSVACYKAGKVPPAVKEILECLPQPPSKSRTKKSS